MIWGMLFTWWAGAAIGRAQGSADLTPVQRKAAVIAKLEKYTGDNNRDGRRVIGFLGGGTVKSLVDGVAISSVIYVADSADAAACDIVYVSDGNMTRWSALKEHAPAALSVGECRVFARFGGIFMMVPDGNGLRLLYSKSNFDRARQNGLKVSSRLLKLAEKVD